MVMVGVMGHGKGEKASGVVPIPRPLPQLVH